MFLLPNQPRQQQGGIFQSWRPKFSNNFVTSASWRSNVDGRGVVLVGTEKFKQQALSSFVNNLGNKPTDIYLSEVSVSESVDVFAVI